LLRIVVQNSLYKFYIPYTQMVNCWTFWSMHLNAAQLRLNHALVHTVLKSRNCSLMLVNAKFEWIGGLPALKKILTAHSRNCKDSKCELHTTVHVSFCSLAKLCINIVIHFTAESFFFLAKLFINTYSFFIYVDFAGIWRSI
jgi:hypothetical protein